MTAHTRSRAIRGSVVLFFMACSMCAGSGARADDSAYCRRIQAAAQSDAALLWTPKLTLQGVRFPSGFDNGPVTSQGFQLRVGLSYSLLDAYRAVRQEGATAADCAAHSVQQELQTALAAGLDAPQGDAYHAQAQFLAQHRSDVDAVIERARRRLAEHVITVVDFNLLLRSTTELQQKTLRARGQASRAAALGSAGGNRSAEVLVHDLVRLRGDHEHALSSLRALDAWALRVQGGVIPLIDHSVDWFGWVELSYSLGDLLRGGAERRYREARAEELRSASYELPAKLEHLRGERAAEVELARAELQVIDERLDILRSSQAELESTEAALVAHTRDALAIEQLSVEADRVYLEALIDSLATARSRKSG